MISLNINTKKNVPINWHFRKFNAVPQYNPIIISEAYNIQVDCLEDSKSDSYDKNHMKEKANELARLHEAI